MFTKERGSSVLVDPNHASASAKRRLPRPRDAVAYFWKSLTAPSSAACSPKHAGGHASRPRGSGNDIGGTESASQHSWRQMARPAPARRVDSASRTRMQTGTIEEQDDHAEGAGYDPRLLLQALEQDFS